MRMMQTRFLLIAVLILAGCGTADPPRFLRPPSKRAEELVIVTLGDSLTVGVGVDASSNYPSLLQAKLGKHARVVNLGVSGDTIADGLARIDAVLEVSPEIVIVALGSNDYLRGLDASVATKNLRAIIRTLHAEGIYVVLAGFSYPSTFGVTNQVNRAIQDIFASLAEEESLAFIPDFLAGVAGETSLNQEDRIHPNSAGYRVIVDENVWPVMEQVLD